METNNLGQPLDVEVPGWTARPTPPETTMEGRLCRVERLDPARHGPSLWETNELDKKDQRWTYLGYGPFANQADYHAWLDDVAPGNDPMFHAIVDQQTDQALGVASYLRLDPANGAMEVGHLNYSPALQGDPRATEAMFLMMRRAFDELGYRRYEWKCNALNAASRQAAIRLGFQFEGIFRQAGVSKGRNRDTAWYGMTDGDWARLQPVYERWLAPENFDAEGQQKERLSNLTRRALTS